MPPTKPPTRSLPNQDRSIGVVLQVLSIVEIYIRGTIEIDAVVAGTISSYSFENIRSKCLMYFWNWERLEVFGAQFIHTASFAPIPSVDVGLACVPHTPARLKKVTQTLDRPQTNWLPAAISNQNVLIK